ncbi:unnamed protein product [Bursaphelenchus okinawaensis]|uniref:Zinc_ribbon_16 domain-containing protein n=1 Tax=Bursaphelenchus okinawaensis TaxID=465554 RepID=A0A811KIK1_9BILA|nr:unnamed protein product [Bursaphelenchus okinawaensis]CAG9103661.1 unnamed protein product [Bursaphelenchus okinawaensis]
MSKKSPAKSPAQQTPASRRMDPIEEELLEAGSSASTPPAQIVSSDPYQSAISRTSSSTAIHRIDNKRPSSLKDRPMLAGHKIQNLMGDVNNAISPGPIQTTAINQSTSIGELFMNMPFSDSSHPEILSPASYEYKKNKKLTNNFGAEVQFLNGDSMDFFIATKETFQIYKMEYDADSDPVADLIRNHKFRTNMVENEYTCQSVALDNTEFNNIAFGFNNGDIFVTNAYEEGDLDRDWYNDYHIRMNHKCESLLHLCWDKSRNGKGYLCAAYERGRGNDHIINLFDINQGQQKDLFCERQVSENIYDLTFLDLELTTLMVSCFKNFRFIDIRERTGFMNITTVNSPLLKVAFEPYNNVQFAGVNGNDVAIYDRRFLSKAVYEFQVGPQNLYISHIEYNPNRYCNISCSSMSSGVVYDVDISPSVTYADHMSEGKTVDAMKQAVSTFATKFSYGVKEVNTSLKQVQDFCWSHRKQNLLLVIPPQIEVTEEQEDIDRLSYKIVTVDHNRNDASFPPDGSIYFCSSNSVERIKPQSRVNTQRRKAVGFCDSNASANFSTECDTSGECLERLHSEDGRIRVNDIQHHLPFKSAQGLQYSGIEKDLQLWYSRSDINKASYARALRGYGFGRTAGSARALIENSDKAIKDDKDESECLKECWKLLIRIYILEASQKVQQKYGTLFPGVHRLARNMKSNTMVKDDPVTFRNRYYLSKNRDDILRTCGWTTLDDHNGLATRLERLMNTDKVEDKFRAATMAMFALQGPACKTYLSKINEYLRSPEFTARHSPYMIQRYQHMVDLVMKALETYDGIRIQNYDALLKDIDQPYLMGMVRFIGRRQHTYVLMQREIMAINGMSVDDRIAFAAIHMDDQAFREGLSRLNNMVLKSDNPLAVLLISGLDDHKQSHIAIQTYLEQTNDIQTAALLLCAGNCFRRSKIWESYDMRKSVQERITIAITKNALKNTRKYSLQIVLQYMQWLQASQLILQKSFIMTFLRKKLEFSKTESEVKAKLAQSIVACNFCGRPILPYISGGDDMFSQKVAGNQRKMIASGAAAGPRNAHPPPLRTNGCPHADCAKPLPCCTICKRSCNQQVDVHSMNMYMDDWFIWCTKCCHGGHLKHLREWFDNYDLCPSGGCNCECPKLDTVFKASVRSKKKPSKDSDVLEGTKLRTVTGYLQSLEDEDAEEEQLRILKRLASKDGKNSISDSNGKRNRRKSSTRSFQKQEVEPQNHFSFPMVPEVVLSGLSSRTGLRRTPLKETVEETDDECETLKADSPKDDYFDVSKARRGPRSISECITDENDDDTKPRSNSSLEEKGGYMKWPYVKRNFWSLKGNTSTEAQVRPNLPGGSNISNEKNVNQKLVQNKKAPSNARFSEHIFILPQKKKQTGYSTSIQRNRLHQAIVNQAIYEQVEVEQRQLIDQVQRIQFADISKEEVEEISSESEEDEECKEVDKLVRYNQRVYNEAREHGRSQKKRSLKEGQNIRNKLGSPKQIQRKVSEPARLPFKVGQSSNGEEVKAQSQSPNKKGQRYS